MPGVLTPEVLAVTAAAMMSLGLCLGVTPASPEPLDPAELVRGVLCLAAASLDSRSGGRLLRGPEIIGSSRRGGEGPGDKVLISITLFIINLAGYLFNIIVNVKSNIFALGIFPCIFEYFFINCHEHLMLSSKFNKGLLSK